MPSPRGGLGADSPDLDDVDDSSTVYMTATQVKTFNGKSHPVDLAGLEKSIREGSQHSRGDYSFKISRLEIRRHINRQVDLNDFTNMAYLTEGSNSHIFSAMWNNQPVIVKMLQADKVHNALALHEFDVECELLSRIDHPNIVQVLGSGSNPRPYIVLERLRDLSEVLDLNSNEESRPSIFHRRKFSYVEVLQLAKDLADAICYIHRDVNAHAMIIHRDLKPENLGLSSDGRLKLFDFGLCRCVQKRSKSVNTYQMTGNTGKPVSHAHVGPFICHTSFRGWITHAFPYLCCL
jgi:serine/threonine protein kinase